MKGSVKKKKSKEQRRGKPACGGKVQKDTACLDKDKEKEKEIEGI